MSAIAVFTVSTVVIIYVMAGYPLLLALRARRQCRPVAKGDYEPQISLLIAVHNGAEFVAAKLRSVLALHYPRQKMEILVASDGSTDGTNEIVRGFSGDDVRLLTLPHSGKCAALNAAIDQARGEIIVFTDVRQRLDPDSVRLMMRCFADPAVGVVSGDLRIEKGTSQEEADIGLYRRMESWIRDRLSWMDSMFGATGSLYAIRRGLVVRLPEDLLLDDMYMPLEGAFRHGYRCVLEPAALAYDIPTRREAEFWRKMRTLAGNYQLWMKCPWLLGPSNRRLFDFLSHKAGRLVLPFLLVAVACSSWFLPSPWREPVLAAQALFYGLALADPILPRSSVLKGISSPARTFVVMMAAAVGGLAIFFVPARRLWKVAGGSTEPEGLS